MKAWCHVESPRSPPAGGPAGPAAAPSRLAVTLLFCCALWPAAGHPTPRPDQAAGVGPRAPVSATARTASAAHCPDRRGVPGSEEDRILVAGGKRVLTGRSQRNGPAYVAEATSDRGGDCAHATVQLYLFRDGRFVGAATPYSLPLRQAHFASFTLVDPRHLRYVVADSIAADTRCVRSRSSRPQVTTMLVPTAQGWAVRMDPLATWSYQARQRRYPLDANGHLNEGSVVVHASVDKDGFPSGIRVTQASPHAELNQAAIEFVRRGCFNPAEPGVDIPVNFSAHKL